MNHSATLIPAFPELPGVVAGLTTMSAGSPTEAVQVVRDATGVGHHLRCVHQVHGDHIVGDEAWHEGVQADGITSMRAGVAVAVRVADCCGILMVDPTCGVIAAVHSGWRGTAQNIAGAAVGHLATAYGVSPQHLRVWLSPCASGANYQVGQDVHSVLSEYCDPHPTDPSTWLFDNIRAITCQLAEAGVTHVTASGLCTIADRRFHSYRRDQERSGRGLAFIALR